MRLVVAAYWTEEPSREAVNSAAMGIDLVSGAIKDSGSVVAVEAANVDLELRNILRRLNIEEAAEYIEQR